MTIINKHFILRLSVLVICHLNTIAQTPKSHHDSQKEIVCSHAAVVSAHPLASLAGLQILQSGGNAFDAAIATQLALAVVYPGAGNIGGGGFMVAHLSNGKNMAIDYREKAPSHASRDMYLDKSGDPISSLSKDGHLAVGVPGTVAGLFAMHKYAKLSFKKLIQPAIRLAEKGFAITAAQASSLNNTRGEFINLNSSLPVFVKSRPWVAGDTLIQKDLAATLTRISRHGQKGFYEGLSAQFIIEEMKKGNGIITYDDLKNYHAVERPPVEFDYKKSHIITMPLPGSGGIMLQQLMKMVEDKNIDSMGFLSAPAVQLMVEAERRAFADRAEYLGDIDFVKVPVKKLVSDEYLHERMKDFVPGKAGISSSVRTDLIKESEETTHLSIIDDEGNAVAVTTTLNGSYGSRTVVSGAGFLLNNEMDDFSVKPGTPNMYGAIGNEKNAIAPGKRMLSTMTPTIVLQDAKPVIVVGSPGGTTIITSVFQTLIDILEFDLSPGNAVNNPKFHHQWFPDSIRVEKNFPRKTWDELAAMGYHLKESGPIGRTELIRINYHPRKKIIGIADGRGDDDARGY